MSMDEKDLIAARLNLDTSKILPAFKVIDEAVKMNAETFKALNAELTVTAKNYADAAKAADKLALTADERRKKILDESTALVASRNAQAELYKAKTQQLDITNQLVDSKLQAQQAIQKKREDAIEQQEKEHQQRLSALQSKAVVSQAKADKLNGGSNDATREKVLQEEQIIRMKLAKIAEDAHVKEVNYAQDYEKFWIQALDARERKEAVVREKALQEEQRIRRAIDQQMAKSNQIGSADNTSSFLSGIGEKIQTAATHALVFHAVYSAINEAQHLLKVGLVDLEANMAGYVQTNEKYFVSFNEGSHEMVMNTQLLSAETTKFLHTTHDLGAEITDVTESARLWGRMYKDAAVVQEMVRASTKLSTVDMMELEQSTKAMESTMAQYSVQIKDVNSAQVQANRVLDSWSKDAHETMAPAKDLGAAFERTGKIADETGVSFDFMNGLISAGVRNTALGGANLGNMWKTVLGTIRTDKAVAEIESLGVATKDVVNGTEQWRKAEDILLDLSIKVIDKNYDLTQSYADISRGVYQYAKLAASLNVGDILLGQSASINSTGSTMEYLKVQMDTIQRKAAQTKASLLEVFNNAGDDGLRSSIKSALDVLDQLLIGLTKLPKGTFEAVAGVTGLVVAYRTIVIPLMAWKAAQEALTVAMALNTTVANTQTVALVAQTAAARNAVAMTALATGGVTLLVAAITASIFVVGNAEKKQRDLTETRNREISVMEQQYGQMQRQADFLPKLVNAHNELHKQLDSGTLSEEKQTNVKDQLDKVSRALKDTIGQEGLAQLQAAGYTDQATKAIITSLNVRKQALKQDILDRLTNEGGDVASRVQSAQKKVDDIAAEKIIGFRDKQSKERRLADARKELDDYKKQSQDLAEKRLQVEEELLNITMAGEQGKDVAADRDYDNRKKAFETEMSEFRHLVNLKADGYKDAGEQLEKLKTIRAKFTDLQTNDLYGIDEDIFRTGEGKEIKAEGFGKEAKPKAFQFPLNDIDNQNKQAKMLVDSATSLIDFYMAKKDALGEAVDDTSQRVELYTNKQNALRDSNITLRGSVAQLTEKQDELSLLYNTGKITLDEYNQQSEAVTSRLESLTKEIDSNSAAWWNQTKAIKDAKDQQLKDTFDISEKWIAHQKAIGELSAQQEYEAWQRVQARYLEGTELRKRADEQVYAAKKSLLQEEEKALDDLVKKQKDQLEEAKRKELQSIQDRRDAYVDAQDEKIRAIDRLMQAEQNANEDADYNKTLAEKQARAKVLESAVGPEGKKERRDLLKEIAKIEEDHGRDLRKRGLETQKQSLEDEKRQKEQAFEDEKKRAEQHYTDLLKPLDQFKNDVEGRAEALKNIQIVKESEKNATILSNLDVFISQYQAKMSRITSLAQSQKDMELGEYNSNKDKWDGAAGRGDSEEMARLNQRNNEIRSKYGIPDDTGRLQHFKDGGLVRGMRSQPVPVMAHAGEMFLNEGQQSNLFKLLNFAMPKISMPSLDFSGPKTVINNYYSFDNSIGEVAVSGTNGVAGLYDQRGGIIERQRSLGEKVR